MLNNQYNNKLIFLVSAPRSLSTAFLRMMVERKDFKIFNEPSTATYNVKHYPESKAYYSTKRVDCYEDVMQQILNSLQTDNVFVKEMSFAFEEFIQCYPSLLQQKNVYFIFLIRNPHHCIISYYKKMSPQFLEYTLPNLFNLTASKQLYQVYKLVSEQATNKPFVIQAENLVADPNACVMDYCRYVDIPFMPESLQWKSLKPNVGQTQLGQENINTQGMYDWFKEAMQSQHFHQPSNYNLDAYGKPEFSEIEDLSHRKICQETYEQYNYYYQELKESLYA